MASMAEYLKRYTGEGASGGADKEKKKKKKKRKDGGKAMAGGVKIFDDDVKWQKEIKEESEEDEADMGPQVEEDVEVRRMQRLEEIKAHRPYLSIGEDGSGWVTVGDDAEQDNGGRPGRHDDLSPPRRARLDSPDMSPPRKPRHDSPDLSPPRRGRVDSPDAGPGRQAGNDSPDLSPPRRTRNDSPDILAPTRRARHDSPDLSPPRKRGHASPDLSPPRRPRPASPGSSPPRRARHDSLDIAPSRRARHDSPTLSPPRKRRVPSFSSGLGPAPTGGSPPRKGGPSREADLSPPRKRLPNFREPKKPPPGAERGPRDGRARMTDGTLAGLRTGKEVMAELEQKRREDAVRFAQMDACVTGRGAQTVYRDKQGKKTNLEQIMEESLANKKKELPPPVWGKGLAQSRQATEAAQQLAAAAEQPFAQYESDPTRDKQLRERIRWGDPMAHLVKAKQPEMELTDFSANPSLLESGFKVPQEVPPHSWIKRRVSAAPNRFGIRPGRHWDGVDRSTGFEKEMFKMKNEKEARDKEAYMWSVADM